MSEVYIPKDLDDCFVELKKILSHEEVEELKNKPKDGTIIYHHGLGRRLRNRWGLWAGSHLSKWFKTIGVRHPDDMSGIIITSFWKHLNSKSIELEEQIEYYQGYWSKISEPDFKMEKEK